MRGKDRLDDIVVTRASAEIAFKFVPHCFLVQFVSVAVDDTDRAHHHTGGAEPALKRVIFAERFLHWVQGITIG